MLKTKFILNMPSSGNLIDLQPKFDYEILENFNLNNIEIKPEAP